VNDYARDYMPPTSICSTRRTIEHPVGPSASPDQRLAGNALEQARLGGSARGPEAGGLVEPHTPRAGTHYKYNDVRVNVLALAALEVWRRPLPEVLREEVMEPIGASSTWRWYGYENSWSTSTAGKSSR